MSADIYIAGQNFNCTYNVTKIFYDHMPPDNSERGGLDELVGLTGKRAGDLLSDFFNRVSRSVLRDWRRDDVGEPVFCARYDAPNGWGSTVGALIFAATLMAACYQNPRHKVTAWF